jgi:hypothetical protein
MEGVLRTHCVHHHKVGSEEGICQGLPQPCATALGWAYLRYGDNLVHTGRIWCVGSRAGRQEQQALFIFKKKMVGGAAPTNRNPIHL